jgi:hypothetical protein
MLNSMTKPLTMGSGGIIPPFCPPMPSKEELAKPGVEGDAARAKKDALEADARRQAVRLLGTYDCHWHPEAQDALIAALRTDRFECVRLEAAIALNRACCCSKPVIEALMDCVNCGEKFGPFENSPRVQMVAMMALERCLSCFIEPIASEEEKKEEKKEGEEIPKPRKLDDPNAPAEIKPLAIEHPPESNKQNYSSRKPTKELVDRARLAVAQAKVKLANTPASPQILQTGQRSLFHIAQYAVDGKPEQRPAPAPTPEPFRPAPLAKPKVESKPVASRPVAKPAVTSALSTTPKSIAMAPAPKPVADEPAPHTIDPTVLKCLETLRDAEDPEVRHTAVRSLAAKDWHDHPEVLLGLLYSARQDKHPGMRVVCIRHLVTIKAATPEVVTGLNALAQDSDAWIRQEAKTALDTLQK